GRGRLARLRVVERQDVMAHGGFGVEGGGALRRVATETHRLPVVPGACEDELGEEGPGLRVARAGGGGAQRLRPGRPGMAASGRGGGALAEGRGAGRDPRLARQEDGEGEDDRPFEPPRSGPDSARGAIDDAGGADPEEDRAGDRNGRLIKSEI